MESRSDLAAELPVLYRAALDAVDELSQLGVRREAAQLRKKAIGAYSRAWDESCKRVLEEVHLEAKAASLTVSVRTGRPLPGTGSLG